MWHKPLITVRCSRIEKRAHQLLEREGESQPSSMHKLGILVIALLVYSGCVDKALAVRGRIVSPNNTLADPAWTEAEQAKTIAVRRLHANEHTSMSLIRLAGAEQPHRHVKHDLVVVMLSGSARLHLGERIIDVHQGDIMEIPRGEMHWAENTGAHASEVYAIFSLPYFSPPYFSPPYFSPPYFSPPYDGLDNIPVLPFSLPPP